MESIFSPKLELTISEDSVRRYTQLAYKLLDEQNSTLSVECAGKDDSGRSVYGICMRSGEDEDWYDPSSQGDAVAGWLSKMEAMEVLNQEVLPNLGYALYQRNLQLFHQNMIHE